MIKSKIYYWIAGTLTTFGGVFVVRVLAQGMAGKEKLIAALLGYALSIWGLFIITLGTRRRN